MHALIIVDIQNDFYLGGSLPVDGVKSIIKPVNTLIHFFTSRLNPVFFTRDWHPKDHISFIEQGGAWPPHCVAGSTGACFVEELIVPFNAIIISKGTNKYKDAYSGFEDTLLNNHLKEKKVDSLIVCGLTTDYCIKNTVFDSIKNDYKTIVAKDGISAVAKSDEDKAIEEMTYAGAIFEDSKDIIKRLL